MRVSMRLAVPVAAATVALTALAGTAGAASVRPHVATSAVTSWQVVVPNWSHANKEEGRVDDLARVGKHVFLGGDFTKMANHSGRQVTRNHLAAVSPTGNLLPFHPNVNGRVYAVTPSPNGKYLYVGGQFSSVNGKPHHNLAAFRIKTGKLVPRIGDLKINGQVRGIAATPSGIYFSGSFSSVRRQKALQGRQAGAEPRPHEAGRLGAFGERLGARHRGRSPQRPGHLRRRVQLGQRQLRAEPGRGLPQEGPHQPMGRPSPAIILDITLTGHRLYAAEGGPGGTALAYNANSGKQRWYFKTDGNCQAVTTIAGYPVFGMHGDNVAPKPNVAMSEYGNSKRIKRGKVFMLSPKGALMAWNPDLSSTAGVLGVWALKNGKGSVYVGGDFTGVHGKPQQRFAILRGLRG